MEAPGMVTDFLKLWRDLSYRSLSQYRVSPAANYLNVRVTSAPSQRAGRAWPKFRGLSREERGSKGVKQNKYVSRCCGNILASSFSRKSVDIIIRTTVLAKLLYSPILLHWITNYLWYFNILPSYMSQTRNMCCFPIIFSEGYLCNRTFLIYNTEIYGFHSTFNPCTNFVRDSLI